METIWTFEDLRLLSRHNDPDVREWAMERVSLIYPQEAGSVAAVLLEDKEEAVVIEAVDHFLQYPDNAYREVLLNSYKKSSGRLAGRLAAAMVKLNDVRLISAFKDKYTNPENDLIGYATSVFNIAMLHEKESREIAEASLQAIINIEDFGIASAGGFQANLIAETDVGVLLNFCYSRPDNYDLFLSLMTAIGRYCGSWYYKEDLEEKDKKSMFKHELPFMVKESLEYIEANGYGDIKTEIEALFKKERHDDTVEKIFDSMSVLIDEKTKECGYEAFIHWQKGSGKPRQNITIITALKDACKMAPEGFKGLLAKTALVVFARLVEYRNIIAVDMNAIDMDTALNLFLQERGDVEDDEKIEKLLNSATESSYVIESCMKHIRGQPDSWANPRIARLLGKMNDFKVVEQLFEIDTDYEGFREEITEAAIKAGKAMLPYLKSIFAGSDEDRITRALLILEDIPAPEVSNIIINNWEKLYMIDKEGVLEVVRSTGDRRFIDILRKEMKEGEIYTAEIFRLLCLINKVADLRLKDAEQMIRNHNKKMARQLHALEASGISTIIKEPVPVELKCQACLRTYIYDISKIMIYSESPEKLIIDKIRCKNCGAVDDYEITARGEMSIASHLIFFMSALDTNEGREFHESTFVIGKISPIDGKKMSLSEGLAYYEKMVKDVPDDPKYLIGYANTLRTAKRTGAAISYYEKTIAHDPLAIEAYASLGQIAADKGDYVSAYEYFKKASEIIHNGNYYRLAVDKDQFKEGVLDGLVFFGKKLGVKPVLSKQIEPIIKYPKVGRNALCPCGSGKKYKKCCLQKSTEQEPLEKPVIDQKEKEISDRLHAYSKKERFKKDFLNASAIYWRTEPIEPLPLPERAMEDKGGFMEWFIIDYILPSGRSILKEFYSEMFNKLTDEEKRILESQMSSYMSVYEVIAVTSGEGFRIKEIFTGRELDIKDKSSSWNLVKWDIVMFRVDTLNGINKSLSSTIQVIPRGLKDKMLSFLGIEFDRFKRETGKTEWSAFMKDCSYIIGHYLEDLSKEKKILLTDERHPVVVAKGHFDISDFDEVVDLLDREYDFLIDDVGKGRIAKISWLKRGRSKDWDESTERHERGLIIQSKLLHESGQLEWTVLGTITITPRKLLLECLSMERLDRGKQRLKEILGDLIIHKIDTFEDIEKAIEANMPIKKIEKEKALPLSDKNRLLMEMQMGKQMKRWLDEKIPALNGMTPREAIKTTGGKQHVIELLKDFENTEERKRKAGEPYFDINVLKRELGIEI